MQMQQDGWSWLYQEVKSAMQQTYVKRIIKLKKPLENIAKIKKYDP